MYYSKQRAARLLAVGESMESVARTVGKTEQTVKLWLLEPDFCQLLRDNAAGAALRIIIGYLAGEHSDKDKAMVALALLRMNKPGPNGRQSRGRPVAKDDTDLKEFSEDQLKRLTGGGDDV